MAKGTAHAQHRSKQRRSVYVRAGDDVLEWTKECVRSEIHFHLHSTCLRLCHLLRHLTWRSLPGRRVPIRPPYGQERR